MAAGETLMDRADTTALFLHLALLSLMAIGGISAIMPDVHRYVVEANHWITSRQFADAYALAQAAPGPNMMFITLVGWQVAGWGGAIAATLALVLPPTVLTLTVVHLNARSPDTPLGRAIRSGLAPITIGLTLASGWILVRAIDHDWRGNLLTVLTIAVMMRTRWNPLWLIAIGSIAGIAGAV
jgi:chromate transporter